MTGLYNRVLVTGSRDFSNVGLLEDKMFLIAEKSHEDTVLLYGDATGADELAKHFWQRIGRPTKEFKAEWNVHNEDCYHKPSEYCPAAGPRRNQLMVNEDPDVCIAFFSHVGSRGTRDCVNRAKTAGIPVLSYIQNQ